MQLNKASKKTTKTAEEPVIAAPEKAAEADQTAKPRTSKSSKPKKNELTEMASGTHHHKPASTSSSGVAAPAASSESKPLSDRPSGTIHPARIAELAYSYWVERGCTHGSSEEDWLRAEKALVAGL